MTAKGAKYIYYTNSDRDYGVSASGRYIHLGLGSDSNNGRWQTFSRDLEADLKKYQPNNSILAVNAFLIRGNGRVDDIKMMFQNPTTPPVVDEKLQLVTIEKRESGIEVTSIKDSDREILNTVIDLFALSLQDLGDEVNRTVTASSG